MKYHLTLRSENVKTGSIPVSVTSKDSCPTSCAFYLKGCYAKAGPLRLHWSKVSDGRNPNATDLDGFLTKIRALPEGQVWRHNQAGDLPGAGETIDRAELNSLVEANHGKRGFTYTHKPMTADNAMAVRTANRDGFTINLSADNPSHADELKALSIAPVVVVVPEDSPRLTFTPEGHKIVVCPAQTKDNVTCASCKLCAISNRKAIIGFRAHGTWRKKINVMVKG